MAENVVPGGRDRGEQRSSRIKEAVLLKVKGVDGWGVRFEEETATLEVSAHGCRFFTRYRLAPGTALTLEIASPRPGTPPSLVSARVKWSRVSRRLKGLFQVGVELDAPGNVWGIASPPESWTQAPAPTSAEPPEFERELMRMVELAAAGNFYELLGVGALADNAQVKSMYYQLARKFHPDRHMSHHDWQTPLQRVMEALTLGYKTLTEPDLRRQYDARLAKAGAFALGRRGAGEETSAAVCLRRAKECVRMKHHAAAVHWLRECVRLEPDSSNYHTLLAKSLAALPAYRHEAIRHCEKAIELDSWNTLAYAQLAELYLQMALPWRARPLYEKILELDPEDLIAPQKLRELDAAEGKKSRKVSSVVGGIFSRKDG